MAALCVDKRCSQIVNGAAMSHRQNGLHTVYYSSLMQQMKHKQQLYVEINTRRLQDYSNFREATTYFHNQETENTSGQTCVAEYTPNYITPHCLVP